MRIKYQGPFDAEEIAETGQTVKNGETVDVRKEIAESLLSQGSQTVINEKGKPEVVPAENPNWVTPAKVKSKKEAD